MVDNFILRVVSNSNDRKYLDIYTSIKYLYIVNITFFTGHAWIQYKKWKRHPSFPLNDRTLSFSYIHLSYIFQYLQQMIGAGHNENRQEFLFGSDENKTHETLHDDCNRRTTTCSCYVCGHA